MPKGKRGIYYGCSQVFPNGLMGRKVELPKGGKGIGNKITYAFRIGLKRETGGGFCFTWIEWEHEIAMSQA